MKPQRKLVLYSDQIPPTTNGADDRLLSLIGKRGATMGYLPASPDPHGVFYRSRKKYYERLGIDLQPYVDIADPLFSATLGALFSADAIHLTGGCTFTFLERLATFGLLDSLRDYVAGGGVLVGVSAGAILMTPNISTALLCGDTDPAPRGDRRGLALVEFAFVPHFGRYASLADVRAYARPWQPLFACPDGAAIVVDGDEIECMGDVVRLDESDATRSGR